MRRRLVLAVLSSALAIGGLAAPAAADHDGDPDASALTPLFVSPNTTGATNSDLAFWGDRAYASNYNSVRIFDISNPAAPIQLTDFACDGPQNDVVVWQNRLMFLGVDSVMEGPECGSARTPAAEVEQEDNWEGVRIVDVSDPTAPRFIKGVYTDCGAHTITLYPKNPGQLLLYVSSYPLRPGPDCGENTGDSPLHEKISVISVPVKAPHAAKVIAEPKVSYPGDPDNRFDPQEHGFPEGFGDLTACHDIGVFVELRLAGAACAEQAQLWRIRPNGIPDTRNPLWVYDDNVDTDGPGGGDVAVDFWHSATFSWDGKVVNFIDESFGNGCPPVTTFSDGSVNDTGRMFFLDVETGSKLSHFMIPRPEPNAYCSAHLGIAVPNEDGRGLLVNAWYDGGVDVIDFTDPTDPEEIAFYDAASDNWSAYWYEGPELPGDTLTVYGSDINQGFQSFRGDVAVDEVGLPFLNPQTQMEAIGADPRLPRDKPKGAAGRKAPDTGSGNAGGRGRGHRAP